MVIRSRLHAKTNHFPFSLIYVSVDLELFKVLPFSFSRIAIKYKLIIATLSVMVMEMGFKL